MPFDAGVIEPVPPAQAPRLGIPRACHQDNGTQPVMDLGLEQKRRVVDDELGVPGTLDDALSRQRPDPGMGDGFKPLAAVGVLEDDPPQVGAVEGVVLAERLAAEQLDDLAPSLLAGLHHLPGQPVGVDDGGPIAQDGRNRALPGGDAAGQAEYFTALTHRFQPSQLSREERVCAIMPCSCIKCRLRHQPDRTLVDRADVSHEIAVAGPESSV